MSDDPSKADELVRVTLKQPHRHGGEQRKAGSKLDVTRVQMERLKARDKV